ncbi:hypothetical protein RBU49_16715 [Clostridium sp. MB40-C1]|uniref:DUF6414 family protein n=1 Tax=Clostridium sp. MB40-C1 TaxID=3070996 RepID=UPI0027DECB26|nr:hypothetical protein [Clostridium sp. MB40-C1]WMJ80425.1 hypothetical protein RBU49_16715 [Clostridium sp. MB40-C1]
MEDNEAIIPLYLNNDMINNLYTIIIHKFTEIKATTSKSQQVIKISTPLSNVTCGDYIQGNFSMDLLNEFSKEQVKISQRVLILLELRDLLAENNLLKYIEDENSLVSVQEKEFVEFKCNLRKNPLIQYIEDITNALEAELILSPLDESDEHKSKNQCKKQILEFLKKSMDEYRSSKCFSFIGESIYNASARAIVPLELKFLEDHIDYMNNAQVTILGKVTSKNSAKRNIMGNGIGSGSCFDYLDEEYLINLRDELLIKPSIVKEKGYQLRGSNSNFVEIIPIAMYI